MLRLGSNSANRELHLAAFITAALNQYLLMGNVDHLWRGVSQSRESLQNTAISAYYKNIVYYHHNITITV